VSVPGAIGSGAGGGILLKAATTSSKVLRPIRTSGEKTNQGGGRGNAIYRSRCVTRASRIGEDRAGATPFVQCEHPQRIGCRRRPSCRWGGGDNRENKTPKGKKKGEGGLRKVYITFDCSSQLPLPRAAPKVRLLRRVEVSSDISYGQGEGDEKNLVEGKRNNSFNEGSPFLDERSVACAERKVPLPQIKGKGGSR